MTSEVAQKKKRARPWLTALGRRKVPTSVTADGQMYLLHTLYKNDFFAVTGMYEGAAGRVVVKINRQASLFGLPMRWIGRWLAHREIACLEWLADVKGVPRMLARWEDTGLIREHVPGNIMKKGERVPDDFHDRLAHLIRTIHEREMAYVDLEKCENVLVGEDGRPWLFDFQIAWMPPRRWYERLWLMGWLRRRLQQADVYHLAKLKRRTRSDQMSEAELAASYRRPWYVRVHRCLIWPFQMVRRWILGKIDPKQDDGERGRLAH